MTALTLEEAVKAHVERYAAETGKKIPAIWDTLYGRLEYEANVNYRRLAYVNGTTNLEMIEEMGAMPTLLTLAQDMLKLKTPALPEKEKAPWQGSLIETED